MSLLLFNRNEPSYKNYAKYITKVLALMNKDKKPISFLPKISFNTLVVLKHMKPTFLNGETVHLLFTPFEKKTALNFKQSISLGIITFIRIIVKHSKPFYVLIISYRGG